MENVATYSEARSEYTKQLATFIVPALVSWFQQLWHRNASDKQRCLSLFQNECEEIARWNQDRIHDEVRVLIERTGCDYMEELMTAVFIAHTKVLTAVRLSTRQKKLSITVPKLDHFIHRVFREAARCFWKTPFLFMTDGGVVERQKNVLQVEALATEAITTAVRSMLPVKQILHDYMEDDGEEVEDETVMAPVAAAIETEDMDATTAANTLANSGEMEEPSSTPAPVPAPAPVSDSPAPASGSQASGSQASGSQASGSQASGSQASGSQASGSQASGSQASGSLASGSLASGSLASGVGNNEEIVKIDTEQTVRFSDYDSVFDEARGAPELRYTPKEGIDDDDFADGVLLVDEASAKPVGADDVEDLDAPPRVQPPRAPPSGGIDDDVEILE